VIALNETQKRQLDQACFKIDHSCGLMTEADRDRLRFAGQEWLNALVDAGLVDLSGAPLNRTEGYREGLMLAMNLLLTHAGLAGNQHLSDTLRAIHGSLRETLREARQPMAEPNEDAQLAQQSFRPEDGTGLPPLLSGQTGFVAEAGAELFAGSERLSSKGPHYD